MRPEEPLTSYGVCTTYTERPTACVLSGQAHGGGDYLEKAAARAQEQRRLEQHHHPLSPGRAATADTHAVGGVTNQLVSAADGGACGGGAEEGGDGGADDRAVCLSMHQPWASLLVCGIKRVEGRNWSTAHRGRLWIASTAREPNELEVAQVEQMYMEHYSAVHQAGSGRYDAVMAMQQQVHVHAQSQWKGQRKRRARSAIRASHGARSATAP